MSSTATAHRLFAARPRSGALFDGAVSVAMLAASLVLLAHGGVGPVRPARAELDLIGVVLAACSTVPLLAWRRFPLGVFTTTAAAGVLLAGLGYPLDLVLGPTAALYLLAASRERQAPWMPRTTVIVVGMFVAYLGATAVTQRAFPGTEILHTGLAWSVAWFAGERTRLRRERIRELQRRALRAEREVERERLLAAAEERTWIARDLHDAAGHTINVIAVRAGAARLRHERDPDRSLLALEAIEELARQTVGEIDHMVASLREGQSGVVEAPIGLASLEGLIEHHGAAGLEVTLDVSGTRRPLAPTADQAAYRILQEALTNAARHGAGSAQIELAFRHAAVEVTVSNPVSTNGSPQARGGHGLIGMQERVTLLGGELDAERANGAFRVHASIPYAGHPS